MPRTYVDNAYNRRIGRVGMPHGSAVISKNTVCGINTKTYVDNAYNRREGRVGMSHGSAVISKYSDGLTTWNYLDTDRRERPVCPSIPKTGYAEHAVDHSRDMKHAWRESDIADLHLQDTPRKKDSVTNGRERWRSSSRESESGADMERVVREMNAAVSFVEELNQAKSGSTEASLLQSNAQDRDLHEIGTCRICHTVMEGSSLTSCGHHFCTHCILQWLERKQSCPICKTRLRESNLIQDREFDRIVEHLGNRQLQAINGSESDWNQEMIEQNKREVMKLKTQIQELTENMKCQEAIRRETEGRYLQLTRQFKEKSEQNQRQKDELENIRRKNFVLQQQADTSVKQCDAYKQQLHDLQGNTLPERERLIEQLQNQLKRRTADTNDTRQDVQLPKSQIRQLEHRTKRYEKLCSEKDDELAVLRDFILPERERIIIQLQRQYGELTGHRGRNTLSEKELAVIQQLKHYYDNEFRRKLAITESMMHVLKDKTDAVVDILSTRTDIGDGLAALVRNYTSLVKENASLHQTAIKYEEGLKRLKRELHHSKARTHELERKYQLERTLSED